MKRYAIVPLILVVATMNAPHGGAQTIRVVNMIPQGLSGESRQNAEPNVTANPLDPNVLVASATLLDKSYCDSNHAPLLTSIDAGESWQIACALPFSGLSLPMDMTVRFSGDGLALYAGLLAVNSATTGVDFHLYGFKASPGTSPKDMISALVASSPLVPATELFVRPEVDQPYVQTSPGTASKAIVIAADDYLLRAPAAPECNMGAVYQSNDPWSSMSVFCTAMRPTHGRPPAVRAVMHGDGTAYSIYFRPVGSADSADVIVSRTDSGSPDSAAFKILRDEPATSEEVAGTAHPDCFIRDGEPGLRVRRCMITPVDGSLNSVFGQERRIASQLSIAVDPSNSSNVFIVWGDSVAGNTDHLTLHFANSTDRGVNWTLGSVIPNATNPAVAVASDGAVGILFQQLVKVRGKLRWRTKIRLMEVSMPQKEFLLADVASNLPAPSDRPYIGDYIHLESRGKNFYGVFSASNNLATGTFSSTLVNQRNYKSGKPRSVDDKPVAVSIDPYFVKVIR